MVGNTSVVIEQDGVGAGGGFETAIAGIAESQIAVVPEDLDLRKALARTLQIGAVGFNIGLVLAFVGSLLVFDVRFYWEATPQTSGLVASAALT